MCLYVVGFSLAHILSVLSMFVYVVLSFAIVPGKVLT